MTKAEERALEAYPEELTTAYGPLPGASGPCIFDGNQPYRIGFKRGYETAEKDLALTWKDIMVICEHYVDVNYEYDYHSIQEKYEEVLRRFKEAKQ